MAKARLNYVFFVVFFQQKQTSYIHSIFCRILILLKSKTSIAFLGSKNVRLISTTFWAAAA
jgi:hypothetical protein